MQLVLVVAQAGRQFAIAGVLVMQSYGVELFGGASGQE